MNLTQPWSLVFVVGFVIYTGTRQVYMKRAGVVERTDRRSVATEVPLLIGVMATSLVLPIVYLCSPWLEFADYVLPVEAHWVGTGIMVAALWLFWRSHADLGLNWSVTVELRKEHELITSGVYRRVRHPMYSAIFLFTIAQGLLLPNWLAGWGALLAFAALYLVRVSGEEQLMIDAFGDEYRGYAERSGRVFPRLRSHSKF